MQEIGEVHLESRDMISTITFTHPQHNSMPSTQLRKVVRAIEQADHDRDTRVILLQSGGKRTFCAGANFDELLSIDNIRTGTDFFSGFANVILAIRNAKKIVVGRVQGKAVGGGVGLLAATDYCVGTKWSATRLSELSIGIGPYVIEPAITRKIGQSNFASMVLTPNQWKTPEWALNQGLFHKVFDEIEPMDAYLSEYLNELSTFSRDALTNLKQLLWKDTEHWPALLIDRAATSAQLLLKEETQQLLKKVAGR